MSCYPQNNIFFFSSLQTTVNVVIPAVASNPKLLLISGQLFRPRSMHSNTLEVNSYIERKARVGGYKYK